MSAPGLQVGFGELVGADTLAAVREQQFTIVRIDCQEQSNERTREQAQEVIDAGLQPLCIVNRGEQVSVLPDGTRDVEIGNEADLDHFLRQNFSGSRQKHLDETRIGIDLALARGIRPFVGVVSNLNDRGFRFLSSMPWHTYPPEAGCSVHRYPNGRSPLNPQKGSKSRDHEIARLRAIVGKRPLAVSEVGYHDGPGGWSEAEVADHMAWERRFFDRHGFEFVIGFQINDGPNRDTESHFGFRRVDGSWKPVARAFVNAVVPPGEPPVMPPVTEPPPVQLPAEPAPPLSGTKTTLQSTDSSFVCAEGGGGSYAIANRADAGPWEEWHVQTHDNGRVSLQAQNGMFVCAEVDGVTVNVNRTQVGAWEQFEIEVRDDRIVSFKTAHGTYLQAPGGGQQRIVQVRTHPGEWEFFASSAKFWTSPIAVCRRPLVGPLRVQDKLFRDDTGYRRVFFCSWFPALRILRDNPAEFYRQIDAIVEAGWQGFRTFFAVGGWSTYWDGREVAPITFQKWFHSAATGLMRPASLGAVIQAWPDYDDLLRTLLRACRVRGLRLHQAMGDMQIICPDAAGKQKELDLNRRLARICAEEGGLEVMALVADTNEYPQNRYATDHPESIEQMGRVLRIWEETIPGILTTMGSAITEEPAGLFQSVTHGDVCAVHTSRGVPPYTMKRSHALVHFEGKYRFFPNPFWQGETMGWGPAVSVDRFDKYTNADGVALYAMHALTGQASNYFNGPAIHAREPLESTWGFRELPELFAATLPEDVATWDHGNAGRGAIEYWWKGNDFRAALDKSWDPTPPRPVKEWTLYAGDQVTSGTGTPPKATGLLVGTFQ